MNGESFDTDQDVSDLPSNGHPSYIDNSFSNTMERLLRNFNGVKVTLPVMEEILDDMADHGELARCRTGSKDVAALKWMARLMKILRYLKKHPSQTAFYAACYVWDLPELDMINSNLSMSQFAKSIGVTKAAVNKAVQEAQDFFKTPPRHEQRNKQSCDTMRNKRLGQLQPL